MTDNQNPTSGTIPDGADITPADGSQAVEGAQMSDFTLGELNTLLGKEFKDKDAALKSIKDTFAFVGKAGQKNNQDPSPKESNKPDLGKYATKEDIEEMFFFRDKPEYAGYKDVMKSISSTRGISLSEVANDESFKSIFEKAQEGEKARNAKTVVNSGSRLGIPSDASEKARELAKTNPIAAAESLSATIAEAIRKAKK